MYGGSISILSNRVVAYRNISVPMRLKLSQKAGLCYILKRLLAKVGVAVRVPSQNVRRLERGMDLGKFTTDN
jgi:hypothetical protein